MQSLAAYSFEAEIENPASRLEAIDSLLDGWLKSKGAETPQAIDGSFVSKTGDGTGQFLRQTVQNDLGSLREIELIEITNTGAIFTTGIQIVSAGKKVIVYASLSATPGESRVAPIGLYPRCPFVIREIIGRFPDWKFAGEDVPFAKAFDATTPADAKTLCQVLRSNTRRLPIIVISNDEDEAIWPDLYTKAAEHLVGLAYVAYVSAESSWVLTNELGPRDSCYFGAVRLYWPGHRPDGSLPGVKWLAQKLASFGNDEAGMSRFLGILRQEVMSVAALVMHPPALGREIKNSAEKARLLALEENGRDRELDSIVEENARLSQELETANQTIQSLQWKLAAANYAKGDKEEDGDDEADTSDVPEDPTPPQPGETRYYKKIGSKGDTDTLVQTNPCNHNNWKPAFKADKAEKGLLKLEKSKDWKSLAHCNECTGGGRWKVHW